MLICCKKVVNLSTLSRKPCCHRPAQFSYNAVNAGDQ